jgi:hypothetical protein
MITAKIEKLQQMANFEGDVRDGNIGSFSQGVVAGERNASKLALEVLDEITFIVKNKIERERMENLNKPIINSTTDDKPKPSSWKPDSTKSMG